MGANLIADTYLVPLATNNGITLTAIITPVTIAAPQNCQVVVTYNSGLTFQNQVNVLIVTANQGPIFSGTVGLPPFADPSPQTYLFTIPANPGNVIVVLTYAMTGFAADCTAGTQLVHSFVDFSNV